MTIHDCSAGETAAGELWLASRFSYRRTWVMANIRGDIRIEEKCSLPSLPARTAAQQLRQHRFMTAREVQMGRNAAL
jgi:hypothetical protein